MVLGGLVFALGLLLWAGIKIPLGRLPGDVVWQRGGSSFYFPITTGIVVSVVLTLVLRLLRR